MDLNSKESLVGEALTSSVNIPISSDNNCNCYYNINNNHLPSPVIKESSFKYFNVT